MNYRTSMCLKACTPTHSLQFAFIGEKVWYGTTCLGNVWGPGLAQGQFKGLFWNKIGECMTHPNWGRGETGGWAHVLIKICATPPHLFFIYTS